MQSALRTLNHSIQRRRVRLVEFILAVLLRGFLQVPPPCRAYRRRALPCWHMPPSTCQPPQLSFRTYLCFYLSLLRSTFFSYQPPALAIVFLLTFKPRARVFKAIAKACRYGFPSPSSVVILFPTDAFEPDLSSGITTLPSRAVEPSPAARPPSIGWRRRSSWRCLHPSACHRAFHRPVVSVRFVARYPAPLHRYASSVLA